MLASNLLDVLTKQKLSCTGCGACANICQKKAVSLVPDVLGFLKPSICSDLCTNCHMCENICPVLNDKKSRRNFDTLLPQCYAVQAADEIRWKSSSGGAFSLLAQTILEEKGVVFGASMDSDLSVHHIGIYDISELDRLRKSKYVQSSIDDIYCQVKKHLNTGKKVLFSGTPCQVAALYSVINVSYDNLYTVDILCHGVPSQKMLRESLAETLEGNRPVSVDFRDKNYGWDCLSMTVALENGETRHLSYNESRYEQGFHPNITLNESCYECKFSEYPRVGDISIGDFWKVYEYNPALADGKGTSVLLVNNEQGARLWNKCQKQAQLSIPVPLRFLESNRVHAIISKAKERSFFLSLYPKRAFNRAVLEAQQNIHDVAIVGNWSYPNYGSELTYYALYRTIQNTGRTVIMLSWPKDALWKPYESAQLFKRNPYPDYDVADLVETRQELIRYNQFSNVFILGSDQLLNNNLYHNFHRFAQMDWVHSYKRKIAYASSFGTDYIWGEAKDHAEMAHFLREFDFFSMREESGCKLLEKYYGIKASHVLDPVFIAPEGMYEELVAVGEASVPQSSYLFAYMLDTSVDKETILCRCAEQLHLKIFSVTDAAPADHRIASYWEIPTQYNVKLEEWIAYIYHCDYMITDSFHGMCMAIIFQKPFIAICNASRGETRFHSILNLLNLNHRLLRTAQELENKMDLISLPIDYDAVKSTLDILKTKSLRWLTDALESPIPPKILSTYDILSSDILSVNDTNQKQWEQLEDHRSRMDGIDAKLQEYDHKTAHIEELQDTNQKQWEQLEGHRLRMDGIDAKLQEYDHKTAYIEELQDANRKQWEQLEDHRLRMDGIDAKLQEYDYKTAYIEELQDANQKQWEQLENYRLRMEEMNAEIQKYGENYTALYRELNNISLALSALQSEIKEAMCQASDLQDKWSSLEKRCTEGNIIQKILRNFLFNLP